MKPTAGKPSLATKTDLEKLLFIHGPFHEPEMIWYEKRNAKLAVGEVVTLGFKDESIESALNRETWPRLTILSTRDQWTRVELYSQGKLLTTLFSDRIEIFQPVKITRTN